MKKIIKLTLVFLLLIAPLDAQALPYFNKISKVVREMNLQNQSIIAISVKNADNSNEVYSKNENKLLNPASALKIFTFAAVLDTLGENYQFSTAIYADKKNNIYIKLGADPLLTSNDLRNLFIIAKKNYSFSRVGKIYIDDTIIDKIPYPDGWMSDDYFPRTAMISPYTLNQNKTVVKIYIPTDRKSVQILQNSPYKHSIVNEMTVGGTNSIEIEKNNGEQNDIINLEGVVNKDLDVEIPVANPKFNFIANLEEALSKEKINYNGGFYFAKTPSNLKKIGEVSHSINEIGVRILKYSDNFSSETIFKVAGGKYKNKPLGTTADGIEMFYNYYKNLGVDTTDIKLVDGSGVSRYNMLYTEWMSNALIALNKKMNIRDYLAQPDEGTLSKRLRHMRGNLWAKTGTLNGVSALCGYVTTQRKKNLVFSIIISNFNKKPSVIKGFEDDLIDAIWEL